MTLMAVSLQSSLAMQSVKLPVLSLITKRTAKLKLSKGVGPNSVTIEHKLTSIAPLVDGRKLEDHGNKTSMYVNQDGDVTLFANHTKQLFEEDA